MGYEPRIGDLCEWGDGREHRVTVVGAFMCDVSGRPKTGGACIQVRVDAPDTKPNTFGAGDRVPANIKCLRPLRPDTVGQRVRAEDGLASAYGPGTLASLNRTTPPWGSVMWDSGEVTPDINLSRLVRIADKAEPTLTGQALMDALAATAREGAVVEYLLTSQNLDAWPNRPRCGRPGHDPACLCSTGWVRQPEPEPKVHETWATRDGGRWVEATRNPARPRLYERAYVVNGGPLMPTRELAIAAWRARHG